MKTFQQISYIPPAAPARRRPALGNEPFMRPEIGFTPKWFHKALGIDFGERWHKEPGYRRESVIAMRAAIRKRFPGTKIGSIDRPPKPLDLLTGVYGGSLIAALYGIPIIYAADNWPDCKQQYLEDAQIDKMLPPNLDANPVFEDLIRQMDWIANHEGKVEGYLNWQGVLNNAYRLRGEKLFLDMTTALDRCLHLFECIYTTMIEAIKRINEYQHKSGIDINFITISNCLVNMISPQLYHNLLLPFDKRIEKEFGNIAIHNCAWNINPYIDDYKTFTHLGYIDLGFDSDLNRVKESFPHARRAVIYPPVDLINKSIDTIKEDLIKISHELAPCDIVFADIEYDTPDEKIHFVLKTCEELSAKR